MAALPRRAQLHLKAQNMEKLSTNSASLIDRCHKITIDACGPAYLDRNFTVHDAIISYLQGLIGALTFNWQSCRAYFGQCLTISRTIGLHQAKGSGHADYVRMPSEMHSNGHNGALQEQGTDLILQELGRRTFWIMFVAIKYLHRLGVSCAEVCIPPATPKEPYPPLPLEVDDVYLESNRVLSQPHGTISIMTAFNMNVKMLSTYDTLATVELVYGMDEIFDWERQKCMLEQCLNALKHTLEDLPYELRLDPKSRFARSALEQEDRFSHTQTPGGDYGTNNEVVFSDRRRIQIEIQKTDLYTSWLGTRSYLVEKYWNLHDAKKRRQDKHDAVRHSPDILAAGLDSLNPSRDNHQNGHLDTSERNMADERDEVEQSLMKLLGRIRPVDLELNGVGFVSSVSFLCVCFLSSYSPQVHQLILVSKSTLITDFPFLPSPFPKDSKPQAENFPPLTPSKRSISSVKLLLPSSTRWALAEAIMPCAQNNFPPSWPCSPNLSGSTSTTPRPLIPKVAVAGQPEGPSRRPMWWWGRRRNARSKRRPGVGPS